MRVLSEVSEDRVILEFLRGEYDSERFGAELRSVMAALHCPTLYVREGDPDDGRENALRRQVMARYRGWGENRDMFENFPEEIDWELARTEAADLARLRYIRYSYWDEISAMTGRPLEAARAVREGREIFGVSNRPYLTGAERLRMGAVFPPLIVLMQDAENYILLEGHARATVYALEPALFAGTPCFVGHARDGAQLAAWAGERLGGKRET